jgi:phosphoribosylaminoimidazolecarboxamide formyltransferase/IMP cyclohydrolase
MQQTSIPIKRALISVSDKTGLLEFALRLNGLGVDIISSGGTAKTLRDANIPVTDVADVTKFPEMMDGRVKTLHPKIHGGILGLRDKHADVAAQHQIEWIDLVVVNLYPFAATIEKPDVTMEEAIENIDIGGPSMIRSAAKNSAWVGVIVDPKDYKSIADELENNNTLSAATRQELAAKAFGHTADYDRVIYQYLRTGKERSNPDNLTLEFEKYADLRYGENPHQQASAYIFKQGGTGILSAKQLQGKQLSYNNIADADAAVACLQEYTEPACVIVKHANPCGVAVADTVSTAFTRAFNADAQSAFGGVVALNRSCDKKIAEAVWQVFIEVIIAPNFTPEALSIFATKPNLRVLEYSPDQALQTEYKYIRGGLLVQDHDNEQLDEKEFEIVTSQKPNPNEIAAMMFAWRTLKHIKSNAILLATDNTTVGIGAGQVSRIDAVEIALRKAGKNIQGAVMASDAFFPFRDSIDRIAGTGIRAVIQPGGSLKDNEVINACNEHGISMIFTGKRCFKH